MYEISRKQERERRKIIFPARLHVRDITENVVGLDLAEMGCRIKSKYRFNILSKIILEFYIPSDKEEGKYVVGDPMGNVIVRWTKPSKQQGYFILGLEFGSKPRENHGVTELLVGPRSQTAKQLKCQNKSLIGHYVECFACGQKNIPQYSLRSKAVHVQNNIFDIPTYGEPAPGFDSMDYNLLYLTICPNCHFTAPADEFFKFSEEDEPYHHTFPAKNFSERWAEVQAELSEDYEKLKDGIEGEKRSVEQAFLSYELATRTFQTLCEVNPTNGAFVGLLAMIRARHAQLCITYPVDSPEKGKEKAQELLLAAQKDLDDGFSSLDEVPSLLATKLLIAISIYLKDVDITGKYMKYLDRFDAMEKPVEGSQTEKTLLNVRAKVEELYRKRHEYHRDQMKNFLPQKMSGG